MTPYTARQVPPMLQAVYKVEMPILRPIVANEGDLISCVQYGDGRAFLSVHNPATGQALRSKEVYWTVASGWLFAAMNDDAIAEVSVNYQPIALLPPASDHPVAALQLMRGQAP